MTIFSSFIPICVLTKITYLLLIDNCGHSVGISWVYFFYWTIAYFFLSCWVILFLFSGQAILSYWKMKLMVVVILHIGPGRTWFFCCGRFEYCSIWMLKNSRRYTVVFYFFLKILWSTRILHYLFVNIALPRSGYWS